VTTTDPDDTSEFHQIVKEYFEEGIIRVVSTEHEGKIYVSIKADGELL
jgi:hypothetical protein